MDTNTTNAEMMEEHRRLRDAVVEAAIVCSVQQEALKGVIRKWADAGFPISVIDPWCGAGEKLQAEIDLVEAKKELATATDALLAFERLHGLRERD